MANDLIPPVLFPDWCGWPYITPLSLPFSAHVFVLSHWIMMHQSLRKCRPPWNSLLITVCRARTALLLLMTERKRGKEHTSSLSVSVIWSRFILHVLPPLLGSSRLVASNQAYCNQNAFVFHLYIHSILFSISPIYIHMSVHQPRLRVRLRPLYPTACRGDLGGQTICGASDGGWEFSDFSLFSEAVGRCLSSFFTIAS